MKVHCKNCSLQENREECVESCTVSLTGQTVVKKHEKIDSLRGQTGVKRHNKMNSPRAQAGIKRHDNMDSLRGLTGVKRHDKMDSLRRQTGVTRHDKMDSLRRQTGVKRHDKMDTNWRRKRLHTPLAFFTFLFILFHHFLGSLGTCVGKGRTILRDETGTISDGRAHYPEDTECQWLIEVASNSSMVICLHFNSFATECTYDFLHIFDGGSFSSPLLGSFSGNKSPPDLCATTGKMLLYLYSDTNYSLDGFEARYTITECPRKCLDRGTCVDHQCQCLPGYYGDSCQYETCPNECLDGSCSHKLARAKCDCHDGYIGESCSLSTTTNDGWGKTLLLSSGGDGGLAPRTGHAAVYHEPTDSMWVYGGYNLINVLDDLLRYDFQSNSWETVVTLDAPAGRYGHTMEVVNDDIIVFGGILSNESFSNELWSFNVLSHQWSLLPSTLPIPGTAHHSSCIVNQTILYVVGGRDDTTPFHHHVYRYEVVEQSGWELIEPAGGPVGSISVAEHSSIYHPQTQSIYIFGGLRENNPKFGARTAEMYLFNLPRRFWQRIDVSGSKPRGRTFHTAVLVGDQYMVVYGGNAHKHTDSASSGHEECYEDSVYLYHFDCNSWIMYQDLAQDFADISDQYSDPGRFGHSAVVRDDTTMVIVGGFRGMVTNDIIAIKMPGTVAVNPSSAMDDETAADNCSHHKSSQVCTEDPSCGYCVSTSICLNKEKAQNCSSEFNEYASCDGLCRQASTCHACTVMNGLSPEVKGHCSWCSQTSSCYPSTEVDGCSVAEGWWGSSPTIITDFNLCVSQDFSQGLTLAYYYEPINREYPDEVEIIDVTEHDLNGIKAGMWCISGSFYPLDAKPSKDSTHLQVSLKTTNANGNVCLFDETLNRSVTTYDFMDDHVQTIEIPERSSRYQLKVEGSWVSVTKPSLVDLTWNGNTIDTGNIPPKHLRPYTAGNCSVHWNCQSCLTDSLCGWSSATQTCLQRSTSLQEILTINAKYCQDCTSYVECTTCLQNPFCEWDEGSKSTFCLRNGSVGEAVRVLSQCPTPCYMRTSCSECTRQASCAWCAEDKSCFPFKHYIKTYAYGQCSHWFDKPIHCPNCTSHTNCSRCLGEFQCGWCGDTVNPLVGVCAKGDFIKQVDDNCSSLVASKHNRTDEGAETHWWYDMCPSIDECQKDLYDCHNNATCFDTHSSYECKCNRGFIGDGVHNCKRTCFHECVKGHCNEDLSYECICDIGWVGVNCNTDCGCNHHSTCSTGIGVCDQCQDYTTGIHCNECVAGSYGDPLRPEGCQPCNCNGHGDYDKGLCNTTSHCYCLDNTEGEHCEHCSHHFYGDPSDNKRCYLKCAGRTVRWNTTKVSIGSLDGEGVSEPSRTSCLWILSSFRDIEDAWMAPAHSQIQLTIDAINTTCGRDYVHVYDGVPEDLTGWSAFPGKLLGVFCGYGNKEPMTVTAFSGIVTISFQASLQGESAKTGFTALYEVLDCTTTGCGQNGSCVDNQCICDESHQGARCDQIVCPLNCHEDTNQGTCDVMNGVCSCSQSHRGSSCSYLHNETLTQGDWTPLYQHSTGVLPGRIGHSMFRNSYGQLVVFGGYSDDGTFLNDMWSYNPMYGTWNEVSYGNIGPSGRYFHGSVYLGGMNRLYISGGLTETGISGEFWIFNTITHRWSLVMMDPEDPDVPPLAGHTLTEWRQNKVFLVGGFSPEKSFYPELKEYNAVDETWQFRVPKGIAPIGMYGHSATWHLESNSLYVFGGYRFASGHVWVSDVLYAYYQPSNTWYILSPANLPLPHLFHSAVTTSRYLFTIGGGTPENNMTNSVHAYQYDCNSWQEVQTTNDGPPPALGQTAVIMDGSIYVLGGFVSHSVGSLYSLTIPDDLCVQYLDETHCQSAFGCTSCTVDTVFISCSYQNSCISFPVNGVSNEGTLSNGSLLQCNTTAVPAHSCQELATCGECLSIYPAHASVKNNCKWCYGCQQGRCIPAASDCEEYCQNHQHEDIVTINMCSELVCPVADCEECRAMRGCMWTRQFEPIAETRYRLNPVPLFSWNCYSNTLRDVSPVNIHIETSPPNLCPRYCQTHLTCSECLDSDGADGGWSSCVWSSQLQQCMSPSYLYLHCTTGRCGLILYGSRDLCPVPCSSITRCDYCLRQVDCGWSSYGYNVTLGVCLPGNITRPLEAEYRNNDGTGIPVELTDLTSSEGAIWHYLRCPPENECTNGDHTCSEHEICQDTSESYICICKEGYLKDDNDVCIPFCTDACISGSCVAPDTCQCHFGFVGDNCLHQCKCNDHSTCPGPDSLDVCTDCMNNTMGTYCESCKSFYVGNATDGGECRPCASVCNSNSDICIAKQREANWQDQPGPFLGEDIKCLNCSNNSEGDECDSCLDGFFKKDGSCEPCECNGHSDSCNPKSGIGCICNNHTLTPPCPTKYYEEPCYKYQCSLCTDPDVFKGTPIKGHQCYRLVEATSRCFGANNQRSDCAGGSDLPPGKSELFVIKPSFVDLDIRVTIDVTYGSIDVYITHEADMFVIHSQDGRHRIMIDGKKQVDRVDIIPQEESSRERRAATVTKSSTVDPINKVTSHKAAGLNSFVTIQDNEFVTIIRQAENRLIVTIPHRIHKLNTKWFYFVLLATEGSTPQRADTPGALIYRQDIPEIDLFIFFSAFLSSFFKLLAILIAIWKVKVSLEARQAARARTVEMEHRRSRPFGRVVVYMEEVADPLPVQPVHPSRRTKRKSPRNRRSTPSSGRSRHGPNTTLPMPPNDAGNRTAHEKLPFSHGPIAVEPTDDGMAAIGTMVISLPGGAKAPLQACLGSGLMRQGKSNLTSQGRVGRGNKQNNTRQSSGHTYRPV